MYTILKEGKHLLSAAYYRKQWVLSSKRLQDEYKTLKQLMDGVMAAVSRP